MNQPILAINCGSSSKPFGWGWGLDQTGLKGLAQRINNVSAKHALLHRVSGEPDGNDVMDLDSRVEGLQKYPNILSRRAITRFVRDCNAEITAYFGSAKDSDMVDRLLTPNAWMSRAMRSIFPWADLPVNLAFDKITRLDRDSVEGRFFQLIHEFKALQGQVCYMEAWPHSQADNWAGYSSVCLERYYQLNHRKGFFLPGLRGPSMIRWRNHERFDDWPSNDAFIADCERQGHIPALSPSLWSQVMGRKF